MSPVDPIPEVHVPRPVSRSAGIGEATRNVLIRFVVDVWNRVRDSISSMIRHAIESTMESVEGSALRVARPLFDRVLAMPDVPGDIRDLMTWAKSGESQAGVAAVLGGIVAIAFVLLPAAISGLTGQIRNASYRIFRPGLLDPETAIRAYQLDPTNYEMMFQSLTSQGLTEQQVNALQDVFRSRLSLSDLIALYLRGELSPQMFSVRLGKIGIDVSEIEDIKKLTKQIPGPADLVRFGLREAWRDDVASRYGYDEGRPAEFDEWLSKQGYGPEWARAFWRSHWEIPSVGNMFEMFHRELISSDELETGLKVNDVAPGWISPLLGITYNLLTRVDVKRALRYGEYSIDEVYQEYRKLGYDETRARILTNIAVKESIDEAAGLTREAVVKAYALGRMGRAEAVTSLENIGVIGDVAEFYLDQADLDRAEKLLTRRIANVEKRYQSGLLDDVAAIDELMGIGVGGEEARLRVEEWSVDRVTATRRPTRTNLDEFFKQGIINTQTYTRELEGLGYDGQYVGWYVGSLAYEAQKLALQEEERAQKERQRVAADRKATEYEKQKAEIDRDIAELNAAIADAQVALVEAQNERDQRLRQALSSRELAAIETEYKPLFAQSDAAIAEARYAIQQVQTAITERTTKINELRRSLAAGRDIVQDAKLRNEKATLQTDIALLDQQIAQKDVDIARLNESLLQTVDPEQKIEIKAAIAALQTEIAELEESQAGDRVRIELIDELLPVELTPESRADLETQIREIQADVDEYRLQIEDLEEGIRQTQVERQELESEYSQAVDAVPGRYEQERIKAEYNAMIDTIQARIVELKADIASRRLAKTDLTVGWRSGGE